MLATTQPDKTHSIWQEDGQQRKQYYNELYALQFQVMFERSKERKDARAQRHQIAQQKCRIYQRSQSSKLRKTESASLLPSTGQFVLTNNQQQLTITSNIHQIVKNRHPEPASQLLSLNASRKSSFHSSTPNDPTLHSLPQIRQDPLLKGSIERLEKKSSYLVKSRTTTPKFAQGYRIMKLDNNSKLKITQKQELREEERQEQQEVEDAQFLPVEYYLLDQQPPAALLQRYRIKESNYVLGYSRWYDLTGASAWKKCRVLGFNQAAERWQIEWLHNNKQKQVSRINLYFQGEHRAAFERRVAQAQRYRQLSQVYHRYRNDVNQMLTPILPLPEEKIVAIVERLHGFPGEKVERLVDQVRRQFEQANHQAQFNVSLPYDAYKRSQYEEFLPACLFQPNQQYRLRYNISPSPIFTPSARSYFQNAREIFTDRTSLNNQHRLRILQYLASFEERLEGESFIVWKQQRLYCLDELLKAGNQKTEELLRKLQHAITDIEHHIGHELDLLYLNKKAHLEIFENATQRYAGFLSMVTLRLETVIRATLLSTLHKLTVAFSQAGQLKIEMALHKREQKIFMDLGPEQINGAVMAFTKGLFNRLQNLPCPSKSYLNEARPKNLLQVLRQAVTTFEIQPYREVSGKKSMFEVALQANCQKLAIFCRQVGQVVEEYLGIAGEVRKQAQKRYSLPEMGTLGSQLKKLQQRLSLLLAGQEQGRVSIGAFQLKVEEVSSKMRKALQETRRQLYRQALDRILKENEKIERLIGGLEERLQRAPTNIIEMLALQKLVREEATQQLQKIYGRIRDVSAKVGILQGIQSVEYKDFEACHKVYVLPGRLKDQLLRVKRQLQSTHRRKFGQQLNKDAARVLQATRLCNDELLACLRIDSLEQMCDKFMLFSNLNDRFTAGIKEAELINERQEAMAWARTDFSKLFHLKDQFAPHFSLISFAKNHQIHLQLLSNGPFCHIDYISLEQQLTKSTQQLAAIRQLFSRNPKMERITSEVQQKYRSYASHLPLIRCLRNPDLRERHWSNIRQLLGTDPQAQTTSLRSLINQGAEIQLAQLEDVSRIASRELLFEKRLIKLKREWKEVRVIMSSEAQEGIRQVVNLKELRQRVQSDIFQVQQILSASSIKFLQAQIVCWRNQVLYKAHEMLEKWEKVQAEVALVAAIFAKPRARDELPGEFIRFQILEKGWRGVCSAAEAVPWVGELVQGRLYDQLGSLQSSVQRMKRHLSSFFEDKKRQYARLACLSDDQFINLLSCDQTDPRENAIFEQTVRKCFQNIRTLVRNQRHEIIKILTNSNEELPFSEMSVLERLVQYVLPNEVILNLQHKIQRELRGSLESMALYPHKAITQVLLLYQRLNFTIALQQEMITHHCISAGFLRELQTYRDDLVGLLLQNSPSPKNQCELLQALYHLQLANSLYHLSTLDPHSFCWLAQPRIYLRNENYYVEVGMLSERYGFQIVDLDNTITEEWSARVFCSYAGAIREHGFCLVQSSCTAGKTASIRKLAALFGHKQFIIDSNPLVSPRNLLEYMRMGAAGMWVILRNVQRLTRPQLSLLSRNLQVGWLHHILPQREPFSIEGTGLTFKATHLKIFATIDRDTSVNIDTEQLCRHFRVICLPRINVEYVVEVKLLLGRLEGVSAQKICAVVNYLKQKLASCSAFDVIYSDIYLINKLFALISHVKHNQPNSRPEDSVDSAFLLLIDQLAREQTDREALKFCINDIFRIRTISTSVGQLESWKDEFIERKLYYNQNLLQAYQKLTQSLNTHNFIILAGPADSGKSYLYSMLLNRTKAELAVICPNAYHIQDLYGNDFSNGVLCSLIQDILRIIKEEDGNGPKRGVLFDGEMGLWIEPLAGVVSSGHIIQPNGNTLLIQQQLKMAFECKSLSNIPPSLLLYAAVVVVAQPIKWQNLFTHHLNTKMGKHYQSPQLLKYLELFIPYIVDPLIEFYETTCSEYTKNHCYIPANSIILSLLTLFETLLEHHFLQKELDSLTERICSDVFNLFVLSAVWAVGAILPEESRKSFTRHFKYLIKRAVQVNIQGVTKDSLPQDDHDLFKVNYVKDRWIQWNVPMLLKDAQSSSNEPFLQKPQDIGLSFIMQRYLEKSCSVYLLGPPSSQSVEFLHGVTGRMNMEVFNVKQLNFNPNSQVALLKGIILREMGKEKYSAELNGFVHGKKTLIAIRDLNLPLVKQENSFRAGLLEFIRHYHVTSGWYLKDSAQHFSFRNIVFCGSVNLAHPLPTNLHKHSSLLFRPAHKEDLIAVIKVLLDSSPLRPHTDSLLTLISNLHYAICRELAGLWLVNSERSDAVSIAKALVKMGGGDKVEVLRRWIFLSQKVYQEKLVSEQGERLFYLINNVLMEEEKIRYKSIRHNPTAYETYFPPNISQYYNLASLRSQLEAKCSLAVEEESQKEKRARRRQSKIQQFASTELNYKIEEFVNHLAEAKQKSANLKDAFIRLIAHLNATFHLHSPFLLTLTLPNTFLSSLDLQECLQIVAVARQAKLVLIKLSEPEFWNNDPLNGTWKDMILGVIEEILSSMERGQELKEVVMYLGEFSSQNDYIIDHLMDMKRLQQLPYRQQATAMLEYFLDNFKQPNHMTKSQRNAQQYYGSESKAKLKQKRYELERKERQKNMQRLELAIISKLKFVLNVTEESIQSFQSNKLLVHYSDAFRQFSILNLSIYSAQDKERKWKVDIQPSLGDIKSKTIITDINQEQEEDSSMMEEQKSIEIHLTENEDSILEHVIEKMMYKNCFSPDQQWLRGKNNNLKQLYAVIKGRLTKLCQQQLEIVSRRIQKVMSIQQLNATISQKIERITTQTQSCEIEHNLIKKQKNQREMDYQQAMMTNRNTQKSLLSLKKEREELEIVHQRLISSSRSAFFAQKDAFTQVIKEWRQRKMTSINHIFRVFLEGLGILIDKKIKKEQQMHKEMLKDLFTPAGNAKIIKKISALCSSGHYNIPQRISLKIKESFADIQKERHQRRYKEQLEKQQSPFEKLIRHFSLFFARLIDFYNTNQQKQVKQCSRRLSENQKAIQKLKEAQIRNQKSKQYISILEKYEEIQTKQANFQKNKKKVKVLKRVCDFLKIRFANLDNSTIPENKGCQLIRQNHHSCTFLCTINQDLIKMKDQIVQIEEDIESYAFTIAIKMFYVGQHCQNDIINILNQFQRYRQTPTISRPIDYAPLKLPNLFIIDTTFSKIQQNQRDDDISQLLQQKKNKQAVARKYFESESLISLVQFTPGVIVLGVDKGYIDLSSSGGKLIILQNNGVKQLYEKFIINRGQLTKWLRSRSQQSYHKVCLSSRVVLQNKNFNKSVKSIIIQDESESTDKRLCIILVQNKEEVISLLKVIKREPVNRDLTIVIVTQNQNIVFEQNAYSIKYRQEDMKEFAKQVESLLINYGDKTESSFVFEMNEIEEKKKNYRNSIYFALDMQNQMLFQNVSNCLQNEIQEQLQDWLQYIKKYERTHQKANKTVKIIEEKQKCSLGRFVPWLTNVVDSIYGNFELLRTQQNLLKQAQQRKFSSLNERICRYIVTLIELIMSFQRHQRLPKMLSTAKYLEILTSVFERHKQFTKKSGNISKIISQIKFLIWNNIASIYPDHFQVILMLFLSADQEEVSYSHNQVTEILHLCMENVEQSMEELKVIKQHQNLLSLYLNSKVDTGSQESLEQSGQQGNLNLQITNKFKRKLKKLLNIIKSDQIMQSLQHNSHQWRNFLSQIKETTVKIPQTLLIDNNNIFITFYFVTLIKPTIYKEWLYNIDTEGYHVQSNKVQSNSNNKKGELKLSDSSFHKEWSSLISLLFFQYNVLRNRNFLIINAKAVNLIGICLHYKVNYVYLDFTTVFWEINKVKQIKRIEQIEQQKYNQGNENSKEGALYAKQYGQLIEALKATLKSQSWIIINLNYYKILNISMHQYFNKINQLIISIAETETTSNFDNHNHRASFLGHQSDKKHYKSMIIYIVDSEQIQPTESNESLKSTQPYRNITLKSKQDITNYFLYMPRSYIYHSYDSNLRKCQKFNKFALHFKQGYYDGLIKSPKNKRQYQRLTTGQRVTLYLFILISHHILQDYVVRFNNFQQSMNSQYIEELASRIYGCAEIAKNNNILDQKEDQLLQIFIERMRKQMNNQMQYIFFKIQQYIILLIQYAFELNYKTRIFGRRTYCTLQYVVQIKKHCRNIKNLHLQGIIYQFHQQSLSQQQSKHLNRSQNLQEDNPDLFFKLSTFQSQGLSLDAEEGLKEPSFKEQEEKLLHIFTEQSKLSFSQKIQEISAFDHDDFDQIKCIVQRLKLYDTKKLYEQYKQMSEAIQASIEDLQPKYARLIARSRQRSVFTQNKNANTVITNAITELFNRQNVAAEESNQRSQINELEQILLRIIITIKKKILSVSSFLIAVRDIIKQYVQIEFHSTVHLDFQELSEISEDEEQNLRKNQEQQIKLLIKKKIQAKVLVQRLLKKIGGLYKQLTQVPRPRNETLSFKEQQVIYQSISLAEKNISLLNQKMNDAIGNYMVFQRHYIQKVVKLEDSLSADANLTQFSFSFQEHDLIKVIEIIKTMHAKKQHQQFHLLRHSLKLTHKRAALLGYKTIFYFKDFKMINGDYEIVDDSIKIDATFGSSRECSDLLMEVAIEQQCDIDSESQGEPQTGGFIWYRCPFYFREGETKSETRQRVQIFIKELLQFQIAKNNLYLAC